MGDVSVQFLQPMLRHFTLPKGASTDPAAWQKDYDEALSFYSDRVLEFAAKKLIFAERKTGTFPAPSECLKACKEVHGEFSKPEPKKAKRDEWSPEAIKQADKLLCSEIGRRAADEGWAWQLWDFLRCQGRWPNGHEAAHLKAHSNTMNAETAEFVRGEEDAGRLIAPTRKLLGEMSRRRKQLRDIAYGNSATMSANQREA